MFPKLIKLSIIAIMFFGVYHYSDASFTISRPSTHNLGLVGHWTFDGKNVVNGVALDSSGSGNNGNLINIATSTFYSIGKIGQGFNFDGTNDYASTTRINNNEITVAGWFNKTANDFGSSNADSMFGAYYWNSNAQLQEGFDLRPGYTTSQSCAGVAVGSGYLCSAWLVVTTNGTTKTTKTSSFNLSSISKNGTTTDEWFHIAGTYTQSDGKQRLYVNGVLRDTDLHVVGNTVVPLTGVSACTEKMNIGYSCVNNGYFNGRLDDVRLYNRALSAEEIKSLYNQSLSKINKTPTNILTNGLVGHWTFDGADTNWTTNTVTDKSGNGNTGTMTNMSTTTSPAIGKIGQGFNFDGVDDYVNAGDIGAIDGVSVLTISAWVKKNIVAKNMGIVNKETGGTNDIDMSYSSSGRWSIELGNGADTNAYVNITNDTSWHNMIIVFNGGGSGNTDRLQAYLDGVKQSLTYLGGTMPATTPSNAANFEIGKLTQASGWDFLGLIDEVRIYNIALSAEETKKLYNMGR